MYCKLYNTTEKYHTEDVLDVAKKGNGPGEGNEIHLGVKSEEFCCHTRKIPVHLIIFRRYSYFFVLTLLFDFFSKTCQGLVTLLRL